MNTAIQYVYRLESELTDRKETITCGSYSYELSVVEHYILRFELFTSGKHQYVHGFHFESAKLAPVPTFDGLAWQWNSDRAAKETRCILKRAKGGLVLDAMTSKQARGFTMKPHFSQRQIENLWRKKREEAEREEAESKKAKFEEAERMKSFFDGLDDLFGKHQCRRSKAFNLLGLPIGASTADIKRAYRKLATVHHPDMGGDKQAFAEIQQAYSAVMEIS